MIGNNVSEGNKSVTRRKKEKIISLTQLCHLSDQQGAFKAKEELFCLDPAGVSGEAVIRTKNAVTRNDNGERIRSICPSNTLRTSGDSHPSRQFLVRYCRSVPDLQEFFPHILLKFRPNHTE